MIAIPQKAPRRLSQMISNAIVRAAFERAERDDGACFAVPATTPPVLTGGTARPLELELA